MHHSEDTQLQVGQYLRFIQRRRGILLLATIATFCGALIAVNLVPSGYQSSATIMVRDRERLSRQVEDVMGGGAKVKDYREDESRVTQIAGRIRSYPFLERVVKTLKMTENPRLLDQARKVQQQHPGESLDNIATRILVERISGRIEIQSRGAGIVRISIVDTEPQTSYLLAKWISELFIDITTSKELEQIRSVRRFGTEQLRIYELELTAAEDALKGYQSGLIEDNLVNGSVVRENLIEAESLYGRLLEETRNAEARIGQLGRKAIEQGFSAQFSLILEDSEAARLRSGLTAAVDRLLLLEITKSDLQAMATAEASVTSLRNTLYQGVQERVRTLYPESARDAQDAVAAYAFTWFDIESRKEAAAHLKRHIDDFRRQFRTNPSNNIEMTRLESEVGEKRRLLDSFRAQAVASDVSQAVETTNLGTKIEILDPAQVPLRPSSPNKTRILLMALIMGPVLGLGFAFLTEVVDPTLRTLAEIQRIAPETVLGTIPLLSQMKIHHGVFRRRWVPLTAAAVILLTVTALSLRAAYFSKWNLGGSPVTAVDPEGKSSR